MRWERAKMLRTNLLFCAPTQQVGESGCVCVYQLQGYSDKPQAVTATNGN